MAGINENKLAVEIARMEGNKEELSIAQIKEVIKCYHTALAFYHVRDVAHYVFDKRYKIQKKLEAKLKKDLKRKTK